MSTKIHHLNCGTMCPHGRRLMAGEGSLFENAELCCHCLLIETDQGLVLVDTGMGIQDVREPARLGRIFSALVRPVLREEETALRRVEALGFKPEDVRYIVVTHLDLDHAGGLGDFPNAQVHVFADELDAAMSPGLRERMRYCQAQWSHGADWVRHEVEGERWMGFDAIQAIPGLNVDVLLVPLAGHTRGHCGVAVRDGDTWLLHCGDAYFYRGEIETPPSCPIGLKAFQSMLQINGSQRLHNQRRLRALNNEQGQGVKLFSAHDPVELRQLQGIGQA